MVLTTLCYITKDGKTLMLHRIKKQNDVHEGKWNGLGGKLEQGETPEECVIREVFEESGLAVKSPQLRGILTFPLFSNNEDEYTFLFTASDFEGELIDSEEGKLEWIDNSQILDLNLWEGDRVFLKWLEESRFFSGKFIYEDGKLIKHHVRFY
ncbi:MAG TPA: 8-oxo-dGTP diphosphatase [Candidatus Nitrosocosmicus sp.]|nr:8-oxo-dGTP diphosphatase [Candidatus Nitrosocosmicus sp.]